MANVVKMPALLAIYPTARKIEDLLKRQSVHRRLLGHGLTTFPQLTDALWGELAAHQMVVSSIGEGLAVEEAMRRAEFPEGRRGPGLGERVLSIIRELKSAAIRGEDVIEAAASLSDMDARWVSGLGHVLVEYDNVLRDSDAVDAHDREWLVLEFLHEMEKASMRPRLLLGVERLLLAEVYDPSLLQFMLVTSLVRIIGDAEVTTQAAGHKLNVSRFADLTWNRFVAEESIGDKILPHFVRRGGRAGRLGFVLEHLFEAPPDASDGTVAITNDEGAVDLQTKTPLEDETVRIIEAPNIAGEAREVGRSIRRMLEGPATGQIALERIAVVARDLSVCGDELERVFCEYRIPLNLVRSKPLTAFPPPRVVAHILQIPVREYRRDDLLWLCDAPFLQHHAGPYRSLLTEAGYIDRATRPLHDCIESRRSELVFALEQESQPAEAQRLRRKIERLSRGASAWAELLEVLQKLDEPATIPDHVERTLEVLNQLQFDPLRGSLTDASACTAGPLYSALEALAREAGIVVPHHQVTLAEFAIAVERLFEQTTIETRRRRGTAGVHAMSVEQARGLDFDLVFILGLNDGVFPAYHSEDALLPDELIRRLNSPLRSRLRRRMGNFAPDGPGPILRTRYQRNAEEPFLFFLAMSMPTRAVILSYAAADRDGNPLAASPFIGEVSRILNGARIERIPASGFIAPAPDCFSSGEFVNRAAAERVLQETQFPNRIAEIDSILRRTEIECGREKYFAFATREELVSDRRQNDSEQWLRIDLSPDKEKFAAAGAYHGRVAPTDDLRRFLLEGRDGEPREWSPAQLSELAACGYKYFARRVLLLRESDEPEYEQSALETGSLVHEILQATYDAAGSLDVDRLQTAKKQALEEFHRREHERARDPAFFELEWASVAAMVDEIMDYEISHRMQCEKPAELLLEHPLKFPLTGVESGAERLEIVLVGQVDRIEIYQKAGRIQRLKVIDYKTSRRLKTYEALLTPARFGCDDLQMPVYALGVVEHFGSQLSPGVTVEASYFVLKHRDKESEQTIPLELLMRSGSTTTPADGATVADRILGLVRSAVSGQFDVDPLRCDEYCPYRRICRYRKPFSR